MTWLLDVADKDIHKVNTTSEKTKCLKTQEMLIVSEYGVYDATFRSNKKEIKDFKRWVYQMLKTLRQTSGLEGFQVFRMLDKEHQKEAMKRLRDGLNTSVRNRLISIILLLLSLFPVPPVSVFLRK